MKTAIYHQDAPAQAVKLFVLKENANGTADLGIMAAGPAVVTQCPIVKEAKAGACVLVVEEAVEKPKK
jgi:hypothetical protein